MLSTSPPPPAATTSSSSSSSSAAAAPSTVDGLETPSLETLVQLRVNEEPVVFDELLVPPATAPEHPETAAHRRYRFARTPWMQAVVAANRIHTAAQHRLRLAPLQDPMTYDCGCGWCPNGVAAYELCAAVTIRQTMCSVPRDRASSSPVSRVAQRQAPCVCYVAHVSGHARN